MPASLLAVLLGMAALLVPALGGAAAPPTLTPEQLRPGDRAIVRSVFRGDSIEEFPAEIVGVLSGGRVDGQTIIARATSERLRLTGVAQGMSGSPVYVDGRLIGALASSWPFARDALFGITPIHEMLRLFEQPPSVVTGPAGGPAGVELTALPGDLRFGEFRWEPGAPGEPERTPASDEARSMSRCRFRSRSPAVAWPRPRSTLRSSGSRRWASPPFPAAALPTAVRTQPASSPAQPWPWT
jgi:hypothetical protein